MKQRKFKFSLGMKIASILSCIALVSVGFASWWIVKMPDPVTHSDGSFEVYAVTEKNVEITEFNLTNPTIIFGKPETTQTTADWLIASSAVKDENLKATLTFKVSVKDGTTLSTESTVADMLSGITFKLTPPIAAKLETAINDGYITTPKVTYSTSGGTAKTGEGAYEASKDAIEFDIDLTGATVNEVTVTLEIVFGWGEHFDKDGTADSDATDNLNPYDFYNKYKYNEKATDAKTALGVIDALTTDASAKYTINLTAVPKALS